LRLWISRSQPGADRQAADLIAAGHEVRVAPVTRIESIRRSPPHGVFKKVIFLSEHAVRHCGRLDFCADAEVYAVGQQTARVLAARRIEARTARQASSDGLLQELESVAGTTILIVAGEDGRKLVRDELLRRGARICEYLCYRRVPLEADLAGGWPVEVILVSSQDGFRHVARLWFEIDGRADVTVLAASRRIGELGAALGFSNVIVCAGAASEDWVEALSHLEIRGAG
jgi:uroporphyrinogen-III synthase